MKKSCLVAMSGGVDSSAALSLVINAGYDACGVTMRLRDGADGDIADAAAVCRKFGAEHHVLDLRDEFSRCVIEDFASVYEAGGTPNPCVKCNKTIKFPKLIELADRLGIDLVATGHYAKAGFDDNSGRYILRKASDIKKDQSYVLYNLTQDVLSRLILPLGGLSKPEVRSFAGENALSSANRKDSQDICFIPDGDYGAFLERYRGKKYDSGDFLSPEGKRLGAHLGAVHYTVGQRRGLDLPLGERCYVISKDMEKNTVTVSTDQSLIMKNECLLRDVNLISVGSIGAPLRVTAKTRYSQREAAATIAPVENGLRLLFDTPQRAMTVGQSAVFYDGDVVVGGGIISEVLNELSQAQ